MTCKDCIHYDMCGGFIPSDLDKEVFDYCREGRTDEIPDIEKRCNSFKDKTMYIELPCRAGDLIYDAYDAIKNGGGKIRELKPPEIKINIDRRNRPWIIISGYYFALEDFGKTVFLTREEAEAKLKERTDEEDRQDDKGTAESIQRHKA